MAKARGIKNEPKSMAGSLKEFSRDSQNFWSKCKKPSKAEYLKILYACCMGFIVMGFIGYLVKLVFIPINNIILS
jgi:protein transport protein SEC61 subunit gamma-like protein